MNRIRRLALAGAAVTVLVAAGCGGGGGGKVEMPKGEMPLNDDPVSSGGGKKAKAKPAGPSGGAS